MLPTERKKNDEAEKKKKLNGCSIFFTKTLRITLFLQKQNHFSQTSLNHTTLSSFLTVFDKLTDRSQSSFIVMYFKFLNEINKFNAQIFCFCD